MTAWDLFREVVVPRSVWEEVTGDSHRAGAGDVMEATWLSLREDPLEAQGLDSLIERGMRISDTVVDQVLWSVDESGA